VSKISELSDGGSLVSSDYLIAVRSGGNVKVRMDQINVDQVDLGDNEFIRLGNSQDLTMVHTSTQSIINQAGTGDLLIQKAGATKLTINASGIGVTGSVTATGYLAVDGTSGNTGAAGDRWISGDGTAGTWFYNVPTGSNHYFGVNNANKMAINTSGIDVTGSVTADGLDVNNAGKIGFNIASEYTLNSVPSPDFGFGYTVSTNPMSLSGYYGFAFATARIERLRLDASGNLGLGVVPPSSQISYIRNVQIQGLQAYGHTGINDWGGFFTNSYIDSAGVRKYISSSQYAHNLHFDNNGSFIFYNAPNTNSAGDTVPFAERMRLDSSGNLLVGTTSQLQAADSRLNVEGDFYNQNGFSLKTSNGGSGSQFIAFINESGAVIGSINRVTTTNAVAYNTSSDQRLKDNIVNAPSASDDIDAIQVRSFDWKADGSHQKYGMIAQELQSVAPEAVTQGKTEDEMMGVDYSKLVPMMLKEIQSLRARIAALES